MGALRTRVGWPAAVSGPRPPPSAGAQRLRPLAEQREIAVVDERPAPLAAGRLPDDARLLEMLERTGDRRPRQRERPRRDRDGDERLRLEELVHAQRRGRRAAE